MARTIQVTPEQLESTAGKIESFSADYKSQYNQLYSETGAMAATWQGKDNLAYTDQIAGFKEDFEKMYSLMNNYAEFLKKSAKAYRDTQQTITDQARKLVN